MVQRAEPTLPLSPAAKLKRFQTGRREGGQRGQVEWEKKGKPVGKCERCRSADLMMFLCYSGTCPAYMQPRAG